MYIYRSTFWLKVPLSLVQTSSIYFIIIAKRGLWRGSRTKKVEFHGSRFRFRDLGILNPAL